VRGRSTTAGKEPKKGKTNFQTAMRHKGNGGKDRACQLQNQRGLGGKGTGMPGKPPTTKKATKTGNQVKVKAAEELRKLNRNGRTEPLSNKLPRERNGKRQIKNVKRERWGWLERQEQRPSAHKK